MDLGVYAHPFDQPHLDARGGLRGLRDLGINEVALAVAYHAGRWLTPVPGQGLVRFLEDGIVHFRPQGRYGTLTPRASREVQAKGPSPLEHWCGTTRVAGVELTAWTVLFHNSRLGRAHPESCVRNVSGDAYDYALCPARPEVREYALQLLADIARHEVAGIELEAAGFMGYKHSSHHDKVAFRIGGVTDFLLSYCFCSACRTALQGSIDVDAVQAKSRDLLRRRLVDGDAMEAAETEDVGSILAECLGERELTAMGAHRRRTQLELLRAVRSVVPARIRLAAHVKAEPWFSGGQMALTLSDAEPELDEVVATHYGEPADKIVKAWQGAPALPKLRLGLWPKAPDFTSDQQLGAVKRMAAELGCRGLRLYHVGLLPWRTIERAARAWRD